VAVNPPGVAVNPPGDYPIRPGSILGGNARKSVDHFFATTHPVKAADVAVVDS
jgi:hypothetical protein